MKILSFIGARGGSKGLANKNILQFHGYPLIHWTIQSSLNSKRVDYTILSSDSQVILDEAAKSGAEIVMRPNVISQDTSNLADAIIHSIQWLKSEKNLIFDYVIALQPTQPLRPAGFIDDLIDYYFQNRKSENDTLVTVEEANKKNSLLMHENNGYIYFSLIKPKDSVNRQQLPNFFFPSGLFYLSPVNRFLKEKSFYTENTLYFPTDEFISVDIDTIDDFQKAMTHFQILKEQGRL